MPICRGNRNSCLVLGMGELVWEYVRSAVIGVTKRMREDLRRDRKIKTLLVES